MNWQTIGAIMVIVGLVLFIGDTKRSDLGCGLFIVGALLGGCSVFS